MALPTDRVQSFQQEERRAGVSSAVMSAWAQAPLYSMRWNYFHRPSVWASMATQNRGFRWQGLTGFKTLFAGGTGIGYGGQQRERYSRMIPTGWAIRAGGGIIKHGGSAIRGVGYTRSMNRIAAQSGYNAANMAQYTTQAMNSWMARLGRGMETFGGSMRTGGIGGGLASLGGRAGSIGKEMQRVFGGGFYNQIGGYGKLDLNFSDEVLGKLATNMSTVVPGYVDPMARGMAVGDVSSRGSKINFNNVYEDMVSPESVKGMVSRLESPLLGRMGKVRVLSGLFTPGRETKRLLSGIGRADDYALAEAIEKTTGNIGRAVKSVAGAKLMVGVTTGVNIALIGGLLAEGAYRGITKATEYAMKFNEWDSARRLEFGTGVNPFMSSGALTERQRALTAISNSRLSARSAIGNEAALAHDYAM